MYELCLQRYELAILRSAFLIYQPTPQDDGGKHNDNKIYKYLVESEKDFVTKNVMHELEFLYGPNVNCQRSVFQEEEWENEL